MSLTNEAARSSRTTEVTCSEKGSWLASFQAAKAEEQAAREKRGERPAWYERVRRPGTDRQRHKRLSWFNPVMWVNARNDVLAKLSDPVAVERGRWVAGLSDADLVVSHPQEKFSFLVMGDTGEGDYSQYAVLPALSREEKDTAFLFICSDVLYPIGDVNDYLVKFYAPYRNYPGPIYAIPGNHDWYDDLQAFMFHFCDREPNDRPLVQKAGEEKFSLKRLIRKTAWRGARDAQEDTRELLQRFRLSHKSRQRGPYFVIDSPKLPLVCIDTGIVGDLDAEQGAWLHRVSADPRPKILLTGKPLWVDGEYHNCPIQGDHTYDSVGKIVANPGFNYVATIGGDVHNYQRYPVKHEGRTIEHIVSGGGGAFMHDTHSIPRVRSIMSTDIGFQEVDEDDFKCFPLRRDSLVAYSRLMNQRLKGRAQVELTDDQAAQFLQDKHGIEPLPSRPVDAQTPTLTKAQRWCARVLTTRPSRAKFHGLVSPFLDWDNPPFYKNFLRLDVSTDQVVITCHGVSGCGEDESTTSIEDSVTIPLHHDQQ